MTRSLAIALGYQPDLDLAPRVIAAGEGFLAEQLRRIAEAHGVPLEENPHLATLLSGVPEGEEIPEELYEIVARVLAYLDHVVERLDD